MDTEEYSLDKLKEHLKKLMKAMNIPCGIIFGSRVRGDHLHRSDLDVIFISSQFADIAFRDRLLLIQKRWPIDLPPLEPFPYTPEEFAKGNSVIREAQKNGIQVQIDV